MSRVKADHEMLGPYALEERVARGGMAEVWRAHDADGAVVCIKRQTRGEIFARQAHGRDAVLLG